MLPAERTVCVDSGNFMGYPSMYLSVPDEAGFCFTQAYQSVGLGLASAIGAAIARPDRLPVAALGDGGALMGVSELETAARLGLPMLIVVYDDEAYGAEVHHFGPDGHPLDTVRFPAADIAAVGRGFGCAGVTVRGPGPGPGPGLAGRAAGPAAGGGRQGHRQPGLVVAGRGVPRPLSSSAGGAPMDPALAVARRRAAARNTPAAARHARPVTRTPAAPRAARRPVGQAGPLGQGRAASGRGAREPPGYWQSVDQPSFSGTFSGTDDLLAARSAARAALTPARASSSDG